MGSYQLLFIRRSLLFSEMINSGESSVIWNGRDDHGKKVSSGIYFYELRSEMNTKAKKMVLIK